MVSIKEITVKNGIMSAICYMEGNENKKFFLKIDTSNFNVIENSLGVIDIYCRMAINKLKKTYTESNSMPSELISCWC